MEYRDIHTKIELSISLTRKCVHQIYQRGVSNFSDYNKYVHLSTCKYLFVYVCVFGF